MAKINIGGQVVDVPNSLDPAAPQDLRSAGAKPNSFGDNAAKSAYDASLRQQGQAANRAGAMAMNERVPIGDLLKQPSAPATAASTPRPVSPLAMEAPVDTSKLLTKPAAATIPVQPTGATNATAGATTQAAGVSGATPNAAGAQATGGQASTAAEAAGANRAAGVSGGNAGVGLRARVGNAFGAAKDFVTGSGHVNAPIKESLRAAADGTWGAAKGTAGLVKNVVTAPLSVAAAGGAAGYQGLNTDTEDYAKRFGLENTEPGVFRDVGVRALGVASDMGNNLLLGAPQMLGAFRDKNEPAPGAAPTPAAQPTAPSPTAPMAQGAAHNVPGAPAVLRGSFGDFSPTGTFGDGYNDMGGGIGARGPLNTRGKYNDFTNIGANGQPTSMSQVDSRTPDQIANGEKIKAQTAATVAAAGGLGNLTRQNALMAANLRDGVDPYRGFNGPQVSIMQNTSGSGGGQSGKGGAQNIAAMVKHLKSVGIAVSHSTLRQIIQSDTQLRTNAETNATSQANNEASNRTQLATNTATNATSRANNQDTTDASRYNADAPGRLAQRKTDMTRQMTQGILQASTGADGKIDYTKAQELAAVHAPGMDIGKGFADLVTGAQNQGAKANEIKDKNVEAFGKLFAGQAIQEAKDGTPERNKDVEAAQAAEALRLNPNIINAPREAQGAYAVQAAADRGLRLKVNENNEGGWASLMPTKLLGMQRGTETFQSIPDQSWWEGAKLSGQVGGLRGALTPNLERGDRYITLKDGSTLNLGQVTEEQIARVNQLTGQTKSK